MITKMFSFFDTKAGFFHTPFFFHHPGQAIRAAMDLASDLSTSIGRHPADYALFQLGEFDDATGVATHHQPVNLGLVQGFLPAPQAALPLQNRE